MGITLHPESRVTKAWRPHVYAPYNLRKKETLRDLRRLRQHPERHEPAVLASELRRIAERHPLIHWSRDEQRTLANLFGNIHPAFGIAMRTAVEWAFRANQQQRLAVANMLTGDLLTGSRARWAAVHGKVLIATTNAMVKRIVHEHLN